MQAGPHRTTAPAHAPAEQILWGRRHHTHLSRMTPCWMHISLGRLGFGIVFLSRLASLHPSVPCVISCLHCLTLPIYTHTYVNRCVVQGLQVRRQRSSGGARQARQQRRQRPVHLLWHRWQAWHSISPHWLSAKKGRFKTWGGSVNPPQQMAKLLPDAISDEQDSLLHLQSPPTHTPTHTKPSTGPTCSCEQSAMLRSCAWEVPPPAARPSDTCRGGAATHPTRPEGSHSKQRQCNINQQ